VKNPKCAACTSRKKKRTVDGGVWKLCCWCGCSGEGRKRSQLSLTATSLYTLGGHDIDLANMVGIIKPPGGAPEPCLLTKKPDGKLGMYARHVLDADDFQWCGQPPKFPFHYLMHGSFGPSDAVPKRHLQSVQPFLQGSRTRRTDRQTCRQTDRPITLLRVYN